MTAPTLAGANVIVAQIRRPLRGVWAISATTSADTAASGSVSLELGATRFRGTVDPSRSGAYGGRCRLRVVGGAGGLRGKQSARAYRAVTARIVVADVLGLAGETLSTRSDSTLLNTLLPFWHREAGRLDRALTSLVADGLGATWRTLEDGTIWIGQETWPELNPEHQLIEWDEAKGFGLIATDAPALRPGVTFRKRRVLEVVDLLTDKLRTEVWFD